jgi:hypothetical protein
MTTPEPTLPSTRPPFGRTWPWLPAVASIALGTALGMWGVLRNPGGPRPTVIDAPTWWRVAQVAIVMAAMAWLGLLAWRRHGPRPGDPRSPLENGLVAFGVPFGTVMGLQQAFGHAGGFARDFLTREVFWWGLASGLTISLPIALWGGVLFGRFLKKGRAR